VQCTPFDPISPASSKHFQEYEDFRRGNYSFSKNNSLFTKSPEKKKVYFLRLKLKIKKKV
jgi:hypothetical protein